MIWLAFEIWMLLVLAFAAGTAVGVWAASAQGAKSRAGQGEAPGAPVKAVEPAILFDAPDGPKDDLTQIIGIDQPTEKKLNDLGVFHLRQIAAWDDSAARWIEIRLNAPGRVVRERWAEQASSIS